MIAVAGVLDVLQGEQQMGGNDIIVLCNFDSESDVDMLRTLEMFSCDLFSRLVQTPLSMSMGPRGSVLMASLIITTLSSALSPLFPCHCCTLHFMLPMSTFCLWFGPPVLFSLELCILPKKFPELCCDVLMLTSRDISRESLIVCHS